MAREWFLAGEHLTSYSTKTAQTINFKLCTHISNRLLQKTIKVFSNNEFFIFYSNNSTSFESVFPMKTVKSWLFKNYLKGKKSRARYCLLLGWLYISVKKLLKTAILLVQELIKWEKQLVFVPTSTLILPIIGEHKKGKLHVLKKLGLNTFKEILKNMYIVAQSCLLTYLYFVWKGTQRP